MKKWIRVISIYGMVVLMTGLGLSVFAESSTTSQSGDASTSTSLTSDVSDSTSSQSTQSSTDSVSSTTSLTATTSTDLTSTVPTESSTTTTSSNSTIVGSSSTSPSTSTTVSQSGDEATTAGLYRLYHSGLKVHLYTKDANEYGKLGSVGWKQEGVAWNVATNQGDKVYRLYHPGLKVHLYTKDPNEYKVLGSRGWNQEGEAFRSFGDLPIYRLYHPELKRHLYTRDGNEYTVLGTRGWRQEGIAFYGLAPAGMTPPVMVDQPTATVTSYGILVQLPDSSYKKVSDIKVAIWSDVNGQDDVRWYKADQLGKVLVPFENHSGFGSYTIHVYGLTTGFTQLTVSIPTPTVSTTITKQSAASYKVTVTNVPHYIQSIKIPVWSVANGQDDIYWYQAQRQADGSYIATLDFLHHQFVTGKYEVHIYGESKIGKTLVPLKATEGFSIASFGNPAGKLNVSTANVKNGTFTISVSNIVAPTGLKEVQLPIWTDRNGQDDLIWYTATRQSNGTYSVTVPLVNHNYESGRYQIGLYYINAVGQRTGITSTTVNVALPSLAVKQMVVGGKVLTIIGDYTPRPDRLQALVNAINHMEYQGYTVSFKMSDIQTRRGIEYNASTKIYGASTIKGPYVASLTARNPQSINQYKGMMLDVLRNSSNDGYFHLYSTFGPSSIFQWADAAGVNRASVDALYPYLTAQELHGLWLQNYRYFSLTPTGREVGSWFESPNLSPIHSVLGTTQKVQSKAGWIGGWGYRAANDSGIVYAPEGTYVQTIMTNADGRLGLLNPLVAELHQLHRESR
ncbi:TPA: GBS Bsp-like repeat-containing protein [Streptococcus suis]